MLLAYTRVAQIELDEAVAHYEAARDGLGLGFAFEAHAAGERIIANPHAWQRLDKDVRRCQLNRFPYGLVYAIEGDTAVVLAVMHLHRLPGYWRNRRL